MIVLRPAQEEARDFLVDGQGRKILADRRGLGKTFPALAAAGEQVGTKFLYVTPSYLQLHAAGLIRKYFGEDIPVHIVTRGSERALEGWSVVGYPTFSAPGIRRTPWLLNQRWDWVVFDEAHRLRNRQTQWRKHMQYLCPNANGISMLTGTPVVTTPADLWSLLDLMYPRKFGTYTQFAETWCRIVHTPFGREIKGLLPGVKADWDKMLAKYLLRRTKLSLEDPVEHDIIVPMAPDQKAAYKQAKKHWIRVDNQGITGAGALLVELRRITAGLRDQLSLSTQTPKAQAMLGLLEDQIDGPVIVWTWHRDAAAQVANVLRERTKRPVTHISGDTPVQKRFGLVADWERQPEGVLVATIGSIQEGLDLFHAADEIFYEASYVWTHMDQCIGRIHREGQTAPVVNIYYLACQGSVDMRILRAARNRETMSEAALIVAALKGDDE